MGEVWLAAPHVCYKKTYIEMFEECVAACESIQPWLLKADYTDFEAIVTFLKNQREGVNLEEGRVPNSTYWLASGEQLVGVVNIRHSLTPKLRERGGGGHIAYGIRPESGARDTGPKSSGWHSKKPERSVLPRR